MSYGDVYIKRDMRNLDKQYPKTYTDLLLATRIMERYPDIKKKHARKIVSNIRRTGIGRWDIVLSK